MLHALVKALSTLTLCVLAVSACGDDAEGDDHDEHRPDDGGADAHHDAGPQGDAGGAPSVYALSTLVWGEDEPTGYILLSDTLDLEDVALSRAREFPGYTTIAVADGQLLVTNAETPTIHRFAVSDALEWEERGQLSLMNEGVTDSGFYRQYMRRDQMAYAELDASQRALWDPVAFEVAGSQLDTQLDFTRDGLDLFANYNRTYFVFDGPVLRPFSYHDQDWLRWAEDSQIAVYDPDTHEEQSIIQAPCPGLDTISRDEGGNLYFSNWEYPALHGLVGSGAPPCVVRVTPDNTLDAGWNHDLTAWTEGRPVVNFRYLREGKALGAVLHTEYFGDDVDFEDEFADSDAFWAASALHHRLWMFDVVSGTGEPVRGLPDEDIPPSYSHAELDGRIFLMREATDFSRTTVYELSLDGEATRRFEVTGSTYQWLKLR